MQLTIATTEYSQNVPDNANVDTIDKNSLFEKNANVYPTPLDMPDAADRTFTGKTSPISIHGVIRIPAQNWKMEFFFLKKATFCTQFELQFDSYFQCSPT